MSVFFRSTIRLWDRPSLGEDRPDWKMQQLEGTLGSVEDMVYAVVDNQQLD